MIGERTAETVKIQIGSATVVDKETSMDVKGRDLVEGLPKTINVTSQEIREAMAEPLAATARSTSRPPACQGPSGGPSAFCGRGGSPDKW